MVLGSLPRSCSCPAMLSVPAKASSGSQPSGATEPSRSKVTGPSGSAAMERGSGATESSGSAAMERRGLSDDKDLCTTSSKACEYATQNKRKSEASGQAAQKAMRGDQLSRANSVELSSRLEPTASCLSMFLTSLVSTANLLRSENRAFTY